MPPTDPIFDRHLLKERRQRWAASAAHHDFLLQRVADDLCDRLAFINRQFAHGVVLDGHHGVLTARLSALPNIAWLASTDLSLELLHQFDGARCLADAEWLPFGADSLDLVVSPLSLQNANDLPGVLVQIRRALKDDGLFLATLLGGETLYEMRTAWLDAEVALKNGASPRVAPFADIRDLGGLLQRAGFALPVVDSDRITVTYATPLDLMRDLRAMAASNILTARSRTPVTRSLLDKVCEIYAQKFADAETGRIPATFEILTLSAWAPAESQPKPLRPGSARQRLADALNTTEHSVSEQED